MSDQLTANKAIRGQVNLLSYLSTVLPTAKPLLMEAIEFEIAAGRECNAQPGSGASRKKRGVDGW